MQINIRPIQEERIKDSVKAPQREPPSTCVSSENDTENVTISQLKNENITLKKISKPQN